MIALVIGNSLAVTLLLIPSPWKLVCVAANDSGSLPEPYL